MGGCIFRIAPVHLSLCISSFLSCALTSLPFLMSEKKNPKVILRTYEEKDLPDVNNLYAIGYHGLVYEGVRAKLWSPITWLIWFGGYTALLYYVPSLFFGTTALSGTWIEFYFKMFLSAAWAAFGFSMLLIKTERFDIVERIAEAVQNDLSDPEVYYLNFEIDEHGNKVPKKKEDRVPSHFWVLTVDDTVCGMIGMAAFLDRIKDKRMPRYVTFTQKMVARFFGAYVLDDYGYFAEPTEPKTAILTRLVVGDRYQNLGMSTLLINRAMSWAHEQGIEYVFATTDEMQMQAEQVLTRRHGFKFRSKNWTPMGHRSILMCKVQDWVETYSGKNKAMYKKTKE
ncbi:hypothetical protein BX666DRAFT_2112504 [Dichotomocladium elegans]|nr:hypothetical protein BX666DRAFT_2112504 [Dichotomocladium elegans]